MLRSLRRFVFGSLSVDGDRPTLFPNLVELARTDLHHGVAWQVESAFCGALLSTGVAPQKTG
jgi:hypothetical protein